MKKLVLVICMLFCFNGVSEAKVKNVMFSKAVNLSNVTLDIGGTFTLLSIDSTDNYFHIICMPKTGLNQITNVNTYFPNGLYMNSFGYIYGFMYNVAPGNVYLKNDSGSSISLDNYYCIINISE